MRNSISWSIGMSWKWSQLATDKQIREMESASRLISFEAKAYQSGRDLFRNVT